MTLPSEPDPSHSKEREREKKKLVSERQFCNFFLTFQIKFGIMTVFAEPGSRD